VPVAGRQALEGVLMPPLLNASAVVQCAHGGMFPVVPRGLTPLVGGAPGLTINDFPGLVAAGCAFNVSGAPVPCVIAAVASGMCTKVLYGGVPAVHQGLVCMSATGFPTIVASPGQVVVQGM
jgi:hypothetical protein